MTVNATGNIGFTGTAAATAAATSALGTTFKVINGPTYIYVQAGDVIETANSTFALTANVTGAGSTHTHDTGGNITNDHYFWARVV
jgi:acetyl-CoA carboxylase carboxyltransferase component